MLVNNAGVAHYMPFIDLPANRASELLRVKVVAPTMLARAAAPGMVARHDHQRVGHACVQRAGVPRRAPSAPGRVDGSAGPHCRAVAGAPRGTEGPRPADRSALPGGGRDRVP
jgi:NAD(P)-dependent dehydrogenase (short-subunit alcohol dehydrogenase family)